MATQTVTLRSVAGFDEPTHPADAVFRDVAADWGIWPDDYTPSYCEGEAELDEDDDTLLRLGKLFASQVGPGEAVEYWELFGLIRTVAHRAYEDGLVAGRAA